MNPDNHEVRSKEASRPMIRRPDSVSVNVLMKKTGPNDLCLTFRYNDPDQDPNIILDLTPEVATELRDLLSARIKFDKSMTKRLKQRPKE